MHKDKILITGSRGLIGKALKTCLEKSGIEVLGIDINCPIHHKEYGDIRDSSLLRKLASECVGVIHLAAVSRVVSGEKDPELCWEVNVGGTDNVLKSINSLSDNKPWIIYASSREVYGQQMTLPVSEDADLLPLNIYARSKVSAENLVTGYRKNGLQTATVRFSGVYGSTDDHVDRVIPAFCRVAAFGGTMQLEGKSITLDFTYIDDVVDGLMKIIKKLQDGHKDLPTVHFTSGQAITLWELAELAKKASFAKVEFIETHPRSFDISSFVGHTELANQLLNWKAETPLQDGIAKLVGQYRLESDSSNQDMCA